MKAIFGGDDSKDDYDKALAEQEHRKQLEEDKARQESINRAKQTALSEAEEKRRRNAFLSTTEDDDEEDLGNKSKLG